MQRFVAGDTPPAPVRAFYPFVRVHTTTVARADNKLAYGFVEGPGRFETTLTRPDLFADYYAEQFRLLRSSHNVDLEVGTSTHPIPIHFSFAENDHIEGTLSPERRLLMRDVFDLPDLAAMDDGIANGTWQAAPGEAQDGCTSPNHDDSLAGRGFVYGTHIAPHDIRVRELGTGQSRWESAAQLGIRFTMAPALSLADGIDALRRQLPRFWFDAGACAQGLKALRAYRRRWRAGTGQGAQAQAGSGPLHDWASHAADALRYAVTGFRPQQEIAPGARRAGARRSRRPRRASAGRPP